MQNFFIITIQNIRDKLDGLPLYDHKDSSPPKLSKFEPLTEEEARQIINAIPPKCCDSDVIPTSLFKEALELLLPTLTKLVNLSLAEVFFFTGMENCIGEMLAEKSRYGPNKYIILSSVEPTFPFQSGREECPPKV